MNTVSNQFVLYGWENCKQTIEGFMAELNIPHGSVSCFEIRLILTEALINAFRHGNKGCMDRPIYFRYTYNGVRIKFEIEDSGKEFENVDLQKQILDESLMNDCGRGLFLIQSFADKMVMKENIFIIEKSYLKSEML